MRMRFVAAAAVLALVGAARADIEILTGPGNFAGDANILLEEDTTINTGPMVQGLSNTTPSFMVDFTGDGENLASFGSGQARIEAQDGEFTSLTTELTEGDTFLTWIGNLNAVADGSVTFTVNQLVGDPFVQTFSLNGAGENFFRIRAFNGQEITSVMFTTTVGLSDIRQIRMGGFGGEPPSEIPGPAAAAVFALAALGRRRRR